MPVRSCGPSHCSRWLSIAIRFPFDSGVSERNCSTNVTCLGLRGLAAAPAAALAAASRSVRSRLRARVPVSSSQYLRFSSSLCRLRSSALYVSWLRGSLVAAWTHRPSRHSYPSGGLPTGAIPYFFQTSSFGHASLPNTNSGERALKRARDGRAPERKAVVRGHDHREDIGLPPHRPGGRPGSGQPVRPRRTTCDRGFCASVGCCRHSP